MKPFTHVISHGSCLLLFQQCSNLSSQKLLFPGISWNPSGSFPLLGCPRTQGLISLKGPFYFQTAGGEKEWEHLFCALALFLLLPQGVAVEHGLCTAPRTQSTCCPGALSGLDPCTGCRRALNLDTRSHLSRLLIKRSVLAQC